jgi:hypothetical protein
MHKRCCIPAYIEPSVFDRSAVGWGSEPARIPQSEGELEVAKRSQASRETAMTGTTPFIAF